MGAKAELLHQGKEGVTPGQLALAWVLSRGREVVPIPDTRHRRYLEENAAAAAISLGPADLAAIEGGVSRRRRRHALPRGTDEEAGFVGLHVGPSDDVIDGARRA